MTLHPISAESNLVDLIETFIQRANKYLDKYYQSGTEYKDVESILSEIDAMACLADNQALYAEFHPEEEEKQVEAQFQSVQEIQLHLADCEKELISAFF